MEEAKPAGIVEKQENWPTAVKSFVVGARDMSSPLTGKRCLSWFSAEVRRRVSLSCGPSTAEAELIASTARTMAATLFTCTTFLSVRCRLTKSALLVNEMFEAFLPKSEAPNPKSETNSDVTTGQNPSTSHKSHRNGIGCSCFGHRVCCSFRDSVANCSMVADVRVGATDSCCIGPRNKRLGSEVPGASPCFAVVPTHPHCKEPFLDRL